MLALYAVLPDVVRAETGPDVDYSAYVPLPSRYKINQGLTPISTGELRRMLGKPGALTRVCSSPTNAGLLVNLVTQNVGLETVTGLKPAVEVVQRVFEAVKAENLALYDQLQDQDAQLEGGAMLCVRSVLGLQPPDFSTHSWGIAIDISVGRKLNPFGGNRVQAGLLALYPYFYREGFFWGAGFLPTPDPMHFEASRELLRKWQSQGLIG